MSILLVLNSKEEEKFFNKAWDNFNFNDGYSIHNLKEECYYDPEIEKKLHCDNKRVIYYYGKRLNIADLNKHGVTKIIYPTPKQLEKWIDKIFIK